MSGGSMDYLYSKVLDASFNEHTVLRRAFRQHLKLIAEALRAIEWNDSCDGDDREEILLKKCLGKERILRQAKTDLQQSIEDAKQALSLIEVDHEK